MRRIIRIIKINLTLNNELNLRKKQLKNIFNGYYVFKFLELSKKKGSSVVRDNQIKIKLGTRKKDVLWP